MNFKNPINLNSAWKFNTAGIYNLYDENGPYFPLFEFIRENFQNLPGDILEAGTFQGSLTTSLGIILRELNSPSMVHSFDTFYGFPNYNVKDEHSNFESLYENGKINSEHWNSICELLAIKQFGNNQEVSVKNISSSLDFSGNTIKHVLSKLEMLNLRNVRVYEGDFKDTMKFGLTGISDLFLTIIDCDLYDGYRLTLEYCWPLTVSKGMIFLDEYYSLKFPGPRYAVDEFLQDKSGFELINIAGVRDDFERWAILKA